jgi:hypothetical protein
MQAAQIAEVLMPAPAPAPSRLRYGKLWRTLRREDSCRTLGLVLACSASDPPLVRAAHVLRARGNPEPAADDVRPWTLVESLASGDVARCIDVLDQTSLYLLSVDEMPETSFNVYHSLMREYAVQLVQSHVDALVGDAETGLRPANNAEYTPVVMALISEVEGALAVDPTGVSVTALVDATLAHFPPPGASFSLRAHMDRELTFTDEVLGIALQRGCGSRYPDLRLTLRGRDPVVIACRILAKLLPAA